MNRRDITGERFGRLVAVSASEERSTDGHVLWLCECSCGGMKLASSGSLRSGKTRSCGCMALESILKVQKTSALRHGCARKSAVTAEFTAWSQMRQRCTNPRASFFSDYGGRGISVCSRWGDFENFLADMGVKPSPSHSLDRVDVNGNYEPSNCRWATRREQALNKRTSILLTINGETKPLIEWAAEMKVRPGMLRSRRSRGWSDIEILTGERL